MDDFIDISIKKNLYDQISKILPYSFGFKTVDQYVNKVLEVFLSEKNEGPSENMHDDEDILQKLQDLGYM